MAHLLLVEDDTHIAENTVLGLRAAGHTVEHAPDGEVGLKRAEAGQHDLIVLDLNLPGPSGYAILEAVRQHRKTPVIVITARTGLDPRMRSFALGADDVLPKPFWIEELVARITRRLADVDVRKCVRFGKVVVDLDASSVRVDGEDPKLTASESALLFHLVRRPNRAVTRAQLLEHALPDETDALERTVDSHMARLRKKLGEGGKAVRTVFRVGYRFCPPESPS